jgi:hypothetical protein
LLKSDLTVNSGGSHLHRLRLPFSERFLVNSIKR